MAGFFSDPKVMGILTQIVTGALQLVLLWLGGMAIKWIKTNISRAQIELGKNIATTVVQAIEQLGASGAIDYATKYDQALAMAKEQASKWGLDFTDDQWETFIEAAVKTIKDLGLEMWPDTPGDI